MSRCRGVVATLAAVLLLTISSPACADSLRRVDSSSAQEVVDGMANKFARGVTNTATGWVEFPKQIYVTWQEEGAVKGIFIGPLKGVGMTVARTVGGVGELTSFFIAWPGFFDPYLSPAYVWQKE